jgi:pimeloyl-ACP methyl ester carboxylesterase
MSLFCQEYHQEKKTSIVFIHGGGIGSWMWDEQVAYFSGYHCIVPDLPAHGKSAGIPLTSVADMADMLAGVIRERAHGGRAQMVGLSLGAQITVALLSRAPELVEHAVVSSALLRDMGMDWLYSPGMIRFLFRWGFEPFKNSRRYIELNMRLKPTIPMKYVDKVFEDNRANSVDTFTALMAANQAFLLPPDLEKVQAQVLACCGRKEFKVMRQSAMDLAASLPHARAILVDPQGKLPMGCEHAWNLNLPDLFNRTVKAWIEDQPLPDEFGTVSAK